MTIHVDNHIPNANVVVNRLDDGDISIQIFENSGVALGSVECGKTVKIGEREFIVLGHGKDTTAVITKDAVCEMKFGENGDWRDSDVRKFCNGKFYDELASVIGKENIVQHTVNLIADDGTGKGIVCKDNISILTNDLYRRYRPFLSAFGNWWWTATRVTHDNSIGYSRGVCCVGSSGILSWGVCDYCWSVRPFCILNSSILVS